DLSPPEGVDSGCNCWLFWRAVFLASTFSWAASSARRSRRVWGTIMPVSGSRTGSGKPSSCSITGNFSDPGSDLDLGASDATHRPTGVRLLCFSPFRRSDQRICASVRQVLFLPDGLRPCRYLRHLPFCRWFL